MVIFGGINEITKEQNDMHALDLETSTWVNIFELDPGIVGSPFKINGTSTMQTGAQTTMTLN